MALYTVGIKGRWFTWLCVKKTRRYSKKNRLVWLLVTVSVLSLFAYIYYKLNLINYSWYNRPRSLSHCVTPKDEMEDLLELSKGIHLALQELKVTHWLAYGSLWGAIRNQGPLPWDNDFDIGVLRDDISRKSLEFQNKLASKKLSVKYQYWGGFYRVTRGKARGDLMVFHNYTKDYMERVGIESYLFFVNYKKMHAFPTDLLDKPLPTMKFAGVDMPVPQKGIEVQKYHYPYDWWKESKPSGC